MRALVIAQELPHPTRTERSARLMETLCALARDHELALALLAPAGEPDPALGARLAGPLAALPITMLPRARNGRDDATTQAELAQLAQRQGAHLLHVEQIELMRYLPAAWAGPVVVDARAVRWSALNAAGQPAPTRKTRTLDLDARDAQPCLTAGERERLSAWAAQIRRRATVTLVSGEPDRDALERRIGAPWSIHVVAPGVDVARLASLRRAREAMWRVGGVGDAPCVVCALTPSPARPCADERDGPDASGALWFLRQVVPTLRHAVPELRVALLLRSASRLLPGEARRLEQAVAMTSGATLLDDERANDDERGAFWRAARLYVALDGAGDATRADLAALTGLLEAMALGVPVVAPPALAANLGARAAGRLRVARTTSEMVEQATPLLSDDALAGALATRAATLVQDSFTLAATQASLCAAYTHILTGASRCVFCS